MILAILKFELKYWMKNPATYLYAAILFLFAFFSIAGAAGLFQGDISHQTLIANSPFALYQLSNVGFKLMFFVIPSMLGLSFSRDYQFQVHSLMYSYPIARSQFLIAKFMAPFLLILILWTCFILGCFIATRVAGLEETLLLPFDLKVYFKLLIVYLLPNSLLISLIVFLINVLSRKQFPGFISIIVLLIIRETGIRLSSGFELNDLSLILEPFAELATSASTRYWDIAEQNTLNIPLSFIVIMNRCLVLLVCVFLAITSYRNFNFYQDRPSFFRIFKKKFKTEVHSQQESGSSLTFPLLEFGKGLAFRLQQIWRLSFYELKSIVKSRAFILVLVFGTLLGFVLQAQINTPYGIKVWPLTWVMLAFPVLFYKIFIAFISFFYAGILINKAKQEDMFCLIDATSIHNWVLYSSKLLALIKIQMLILSCIFLSGILVQSMNSYYDFELHHYAFDLYCIHLTEMIIWGILALFIHTIISNTWIGLFTLALLYFGVSELPMIGIEQWIFRFNENPDPGFYLHYSDLSGYSHSLKAYFIYKVYWFIFSGILMAITLLVWKRGLIFSVKELLKNLQLRLQGGMVLAISFLCIGFLSAGIWIHSQEKNSDIPSANQMEIVEKESDKRWSYLEILPQPRIIGVKVNMDIYPEEFKFTSSGQYSMVNLSSSPIDSILVRTSHEVSTKFELDKSYSITLNDPDSKFNILKLECPLLPGDTLKLNFQLKSIDNTIFQKNNNVEKNGTYITSLIYPAIGYRSSKTDRKAHEEGATDNHYRSFDSDFISLELLVSTSEDQTAIAPGYLEKSYIERGRKFFKYISKSPVTNDYAFVTGKFEVYKDLWRGKALEIYYHPKHRYNLEHLILGIKKTLAYQNENLSPYQHEHIRIAEFSRNLGGFAQSFANFIPDSEMGFIMNIQGPNKKGLNLPFLGASHELAHQWWGMQAIPADVEGFKMITESLAEYTSLMVLKQEYGPEKALEFQKKALQIYLSGRRDLESDEPPLMFNRGNEHAFIPYQKGMLAFNGLAGMIGKNCMNEALRDYLHCVVGKKDNYSTPSDLIDYMRRYTPDSMQYLIRDLFETVTFYDNSIDSIHVDSLQDGTFEVGVYFSIKKYLLNEFAEKVYFQDQNLKDRSTEKDALLLQDYIPIGIYGTSTYHNPLYLSLVKSTAKNNFIRVKLGKLPHRIELDPWLYLIDMNRHDNVYRINKSKF